MAKKSLQTIKIGPTFNKNDKTWYNAKGNKLSSDKGYINSKGNIITFYKDDGTVIKRPNNKYSLKDKFKDIGNLIKGVYTYIRQPSEMHQSDKIKIAVNSILKDMPIDRQKELIRAGMEQSGEGNYGYNDAIPIIKRYIGNMTNNPQTPNYTGNSSNNKRNFISLYLDRNEDGFENVTNNVLYKEGADYIKYIRENYPNYIGQIQTYKGDADGKELLLTKDYIDKNLNKIIGENVQHGGNDNIADGLRMIKQDKDGNYYAIDSDIWDFNPKDWNGKWEGEQSEILNNYGKPFIIKNRRPIKIINKRKELGGEF